MRAQFSICITQKSADRLAIHELIASYAHCPDRRNAKGQTAFFTPDPHFVAYMDATNPKPSMELTFARSARAVFEGRGNLAMLGRGDEMAKMSKLDHFRKSVRSAARSLVGGFSWASGGLVTPTDIEEHRAAVAFRPKIDAFHGTVQPSRLHVSGSLCGDFLNSRST
ncbi:nuclear transport factor 2 family protein [Mesorhizobium sp. B2-3-5]|uniref:nuclear transport factor 2 family protein n=1 Tax=Mesorhizobium sp. B2-3-5 TaxID=2589958 RepID=UPI001129064D|nr:nuclear transport factor 2 family protein [Mesorhizobium sp. B2-3-5]TPM26589.1 hypothetical protein FJ958_19675 [Mesorhizobium sp. B2-3-5]